MELSVVILSYNVRPYVWQCIDSVQFAINGLNAEIILVDNASSDDTVQSIMRDFPQVRFVANTENLGFSKAYNQAIDQALGEYICILNPDTVLAESVFKTLIKKFNTHKNLGALGIKFIDGRGQFLPECKRRIPTPKGSLKKLLGWSENNQGYYQDNLAPDQEGQAEILAGAFLMMRKGDYLSVNGFDEHYFMFGEDIDLCYKLIKNGLQNYYVGTQKMIHYKGESTQKNRQYLERFYGAMIHFYRTHFSQNRLELFAVWIFAQILIMRRGIWPRKSKVMDGSPSLVVWVSQRNEIPDSLRQWLPKGPWRIDPDQVKIISPKDLNLQHLENARLIFDRASMSYSDIIEAMAQGVEKNQFFRIWHDKRGLLIGSDSSDAQGQALYLSE